MSRLSQLVIVLNFRGFTYKMTDFELNRLTHIEDVKEFYEILGLNDTLHNPSVFIDYDPALDPTPNLEQEKKEYAISLTERGYGADVMAEYNQQYRSNMVVEPFSDPNYVKTGRTNDIPRFSRALKLITFMLYIRRHAEYFYVSILGFNEKEKFTFSSKIKDQWFSDEETAQSNFVKIFDLFSRMKKIYIVGPQILCLCLESYAPKEGDTSFRSPTNKSLRSGGMFEPKVFRLIIKYM